MNGYEIADKFDWDKTTYEVHTWCLEAQSVCRQQAKRIEELEKIYT